MYQRIVVPVDGSAAGEEALQQAVEMARVFHAPIHLLRVVDLSKLGRYGAYGLAVEYSALDLVLNEERDASRAYLDELQGRLSAEGVKVTSNLREGLSAREIVAETAPGDLLVMASHGRTGLKRWFLGSVAGEVLRHATCPVLLVRATEGSSAPAAAG